MDNIELSIIATINESLTTCQGLIGCLVSPQFKIWNSKSPDLLPVSCRWYVSDKCDCMDVDARIWFLAIKLDTAYIEINLVPSLDNKRYYDFCDPRCFDQIIYDIIHDFRHAWTDFSDDIIDLLLYKNIRFPDDLPTTFEGWIKAGYINLEIQKIREYLNITKIRRFLEVFEKAQQ